jgi:4-hydroxymandelate oxidase
VLDSAPASLDVLPAIREHVGTELPVLLDRGIRSDRDAFNALAHGATAGLAAAPARCHG